jgi:xanthine dehydrogenase accessory factor
VKELTSILGQLARPETYPAVLATLVCVAGSSYRRPGARLLLTAGGARVGSISGGCLEQDLLNRAAAARASEKSEVVVYDTTSENDLVWGVGLGCHGVVHILVEYLPAPPAWLEPAHLHVASRKAFQLTCVHGGISSRSLGTFWGPPEHPSPAAPEERFVQSIDPRLSLLIFGAGDDVQPLVRLAHELAWSITVVDPRPAFATRERFPLADKILTGPLVNHLGQLPTDTRTAAVIMTHHYVHDLPVLEALMHHPLAYLGLLGPRKRAERLLNDVRARNPTAPPDLEHRIRAPVGLDLGGDTPEGVALAITAEIQSTLAGRDGRPLRERTRPIHP